MTARQQRRAKRRVTPAPALPRPASDAEPIEAPSSAPPVSSRTATAIRQESRHHAAPREHHIMEDYSYVKGDLVLIGVVGSICLAFIVGMSFVL